MRILESKRMILRPWKISDLNDLHEIMSNKEVSALAGFNLRICKDDTLNTLNQFIVDSSDSLWAIELKNTNNAIGYGITKEDWQSGNTSPVNWNDFKY